MYDTHTMASIIATAWILCGIAFHFLVTKKLVKKTLEANGIPLEAISNNRAMLALVVDIVTWPIGLCTVLVMFVVALWRKRQELKIHFLGYWPLTAHSMNAVGHWARIRKMMLDDKKEMWEIGQELSHFDHHMAELGHCLKVQYGMDAGFPPEQEEDKPEDVELGEVV